jgi:RNA polymerase sigma factor (sigma-70 family)
MDGRRDDSRLVASARRGDRAAFAELLDRHRPRVVAVARRMLADRAEAEDVVQEAALRAYLDLGRLHDGGRFGAWLCGIAVNLAKMRLRSRRATVPLEDLGGGRVVPATALPGDGLPTPQEALEAAELLSVVQSAVHLLPPGQRDAVLLHYLDGLSCREVAALLGRSEGSVRVGLHRARTHLRERLAPLAPSSRKESSMIEVSLEDVVVRVLPENGDREPTLANELRIVLLRERGGERVLPIWVGAPEGDSLALELGGESTPRPLTPDLMARLLEAAAARVERVVISSLQEKTFYAVVVVSGASGPREVDARPSDALNLAARVGARVYVEDGVLEQSAIRAAEIFGDLDRVREKAGEPELEGEWRSLSPELVRTVGSFRQR